MRMGYKVSPILIPLQPFVGAYKKEIKVRLFGMSACRLQASGKSDAYQVGTPKYFPHAIGLRVVGHLVTILDLLREDSQLMFDIVIFDFPIKSRQGFLGFVDLASGDVPTGRFGNKKETDGSETESGEHGIQVQR